MAVAFKYITKELLLIFLVVLLVVLVVVMSGRFISYLQDAASGRYAAEVLWLLIALRLPEFVQITGPLAFFVALLLTYGRLHAEQEFTVMLSGGANPLRMLGWLLVVALPLTAAIAYFSFELTPATKRAFEDVSLEQRAKTALDAITPGVFADFRHGQRVAYVENVDRDQRRLHGVFLSERSDRSFANVWADDGSLHVDEVTGSRFMLLENGARYEGVPGHADFRVVHFRRLGQRVEDAPLRARRPDPAIIATASLDGNKPRHAAELHWRLALPLMVLIGGLCAFGMARVAPRAGRFGKVAPGVALYIAYYLMLIFVKNAVGDEDVPNWLGLWPVHAVMLGIAVVLTRASYRPA